jgi:hypothetical protein
MTDSTYPDLASVEDWLSSKGYTGEAGACHAAMSLIRKQEARLAEFVANYNDALKMLANQARTIKGRDDRIAELEAALKPFADLEIVTAAQWEGDIALYAIAASKLRAARAALENKND